MALVLRTDPELISLPDHGLVGEDGALQVLSRLTIRTSRLDLSHNLLQSPGAIKLFTGLELFRPRLNAVPRNRSQHSSAGKEWSIREVNLGANGIGDEGLEAILRYAKLDEGLKEVRLQGNDIRLTTHLPAIIECLNASRLTTLSLTNNPNISSRSLSTFFQLLDLPSLTALHLSTCNITSEIAPDIAEYLKSTRSRNLQLLELNGNILGVDGVSAIVHAVEASHFGLLGLGLAANEILGRAYSEDEGSFTTGINGAGGEAGLEHGLENEGDRDSRDDGTNSSGTRRAPSAEERQREERELEHLLRFKLKPVLERNRILTKRIRTAGVKVLVPARILLNAREQTDEVNAQRIIEDVSAISDLRLASSSRSASKRRPFPLLELPPEVIQLIVRHASGDAYAFSEQQFARVRTQALSRDKMRKMRERGDAIYDEIYEEMEQQAGSLWSSIDQKNFLSRLEGRWKDWWLTEVGLDRWEVD